MSVQTKEVLKSYFETGDKPTEQQFADLIDSLAHVDSVATSTTVQVVAAIDDGPTKSIAASVWSTLGNSMPNVRFLNAAGELENIPYKFVGAPTATALEIYFGEVLTEVKYITLT